MSTCEWRIEQSQKIQTSVDSKLEAAHLPLYCRGHSLVYLELTSNAWNRHWLVST